MKAANVLWYDAKSIDEWTEIESFEFEFPLIQSFGIIVSENDLYIALALNYDISERLASCVMMIPKSLIKSIKTGTIVMDESND